MSEWNKVKLKDILSPKGYIRGPFGSALKRGEMQSSGIPVYEQEHAINEIRHFRYFIDEKKYDKLRRFTVVENDIIISCSGTVGRISVIKKSDPKGIISQALLILRSNPDIINVDYLKYFLRSKIGQNALLERSNGSVQVNICKREIIEEIPIPLPALNVQRNIVKVLSSFDDKIELNAKINHDLEEQAKAIFKSWFVDFEPFQNGKFIDSEWGKIPEGWRFGTLNEIADITMGQSPKGASYNEAGVGTVFYQGRAEFTNRFPTRRLFTTEPKRFASAKDILLSVRAPVGDMNIANEKCCIGRGLAAIHAKKEFFSFVFYTMQNLKPELDKYNGEGTVFGCINKDALNTLKVLVSPEDIISNFEKIVSLLDIQYLVNVEENMRLSLLRDSLLPKLMSGEIDVSEVEI